MADKDIYRLLTKNDTRVFITQAEACRALSKDRKTLAPIFAGLQKYRIPPESREVSYEAVEIYRKVKSCKVYE